MKRIILNLQQRKKLAELRPSGVSFFEWVVEAHGLMYICTNNFSEATYEIVCEKKALLFLLSVI